jgi:hypothetical protein
MTDQKIKYILASVVLIISFISLVGAVSTNPSYIILSEEHTSQQIEFIGLTESSTLTLSDSISSYAHLNFYDVSPQNYIVIISLNSGVPPGSYVGSINYNGGSIPVGITIANSQVSSSTSNCDIEIFPTVLSNIKIAQGETKTRTIIITVPSCYPSYVKVNGVSLATDERPIQLSELSLGNVQPGNSISIPILIDATEVSTGQYSDQLSLSIYNSSGNKINTQTVSIGVYVSSGISPLNNATFTTAPSCALSSTIFSPNSSYSFTCSNVVSNLVIEPQYSDYFIGTSTETSSSLYIYRFTPTKYGETNFTAIFKYGGSPIFQAFNQKIIISSTGSSSGTKLKLLFTPKLDQATGTENKFLIQLADNVSGSLVSSPHIFVDAVEINVSSETFDYPFKPGINYEIRGRANGYEDLIQIINITPNKINILISPATGDTFTTFNITTSVANSTITIAGINYTDNYYGSLAEGFNEIRATKNGYNTEVINFTVSTSLRIVSFSGEFKKGVQQNFTLSKNASWVVIYKDKMESQINTEYVKGDGNFISFKPEKSGVYIVQAEGLNIGTYETQKFSLNSKGLFGWANWVWILIGVVIFVVVLLIFLSRRNSKFTPTDGGGAPFTVGV